MKRILVTDGLEKSAVERLQKEGFEVVQEFYIPEKLLFEIQNFDAIVVRSATKLTKPILDAAATSGRLKLIIRAGVGVDNIDIGYANTKGIFVKNTPNASSASVAELAIGHMFCLARYMHISNHSMRLGQWNKKEYTGIELAGKTLGLIGFGRIAWETATRAKALGMHIIYTNRSGIQSDKEFKFKPFDELLHESDFISLHIPGNTDKKPLLGNFEFSKMKDGVFIVNTARGGLIHESSLLQALESGKVAGAALDVFEEEPTKNEALYTHPRVSLSPHIGGSTIEAQERIGEEIVSIVLAQFK